MEKNNKRKNGQGKFKKNSRAVVRISFRKTAIWIKFDREDRFFSQSIEILP
jgi:hypothetical protein